VRAAGSGMDGTAAIVMALAEYHHDVVARQPTALAAIISVQTVLCHLAGLRRVRAFRLGHR
jgi:hypothetical protein